MKKILMALAATTMLVSFSAPSIAAINPANIYESSHTINILNAIDKEVADGETAGVIGMFAWASVDGKIYSLALNELRKHGSNAGKFFAQHVQTEYATNFAKIQDAVDSTMNLINAGVPADVAINTIATISADVTTETITVFVTDQMAYDRGHRDGVASVTPDPMDGSFADGAASVTPEDGVTQADVDAANMAEGPGSAYARGFAAGAMQEGGELGLSTDQIIDRINATSEAMIVTITGTPATSDYAPATFRGIEPGDYFSYEVVVAGADGGTTATRYGVRAVGGELLGWDTQETRPTTGHFLGAATEAGTAGRGAKIAELNGMLDNDQLILDTGQIGEAASADYTRVVNTEITADYLVRAVGNGVPARLATSADVVADTYLPADYSGLTPGFYHAQIEADTVLPNGIDLSGMYVTYGVESVGGAITVTHGFPGTSTPGEFLGVVSYDDVLDLTARAQLIQDNRLGTFRAANTVVDVRGNGVVAGVTMIDAVASTEYTLSFTGGDLNANELATYAIENGVVASESAYSPYTGKDDAAEALGFRYGRADNYGAGRAAYSGAPEIQVFTYNAAVQAAPARPAEVGDFYETDRSGRYIYSTTNDGGAEWRYESNTGTSRWATTDGRDSLGTISGTLPSADMSDSFVTTRYNQDFTATEAREHNRRLGTDTSANFLFGEVIDANHLREIQQAVNAAYDQGYEDGYKDGFKDGYTVGFADGVDSVTN